jgi:arylsulfatase A-like enzyme
VVVVTSDHGEAFGEHGRFLHNTTLYDEMIRVPLVFRLPPGLGGAPARVRERVALVDLAPTLEDLFGLGRRLGAQSDGTSLLPSLASGAKPAARPVYSQTSDQTAVVRDDWKLIVKASEGGDVHELYDLSDDPAEQRDRAADSVARARDLLESVAGLRDGGIERLGLEAMVDGLSVDARQRLESLGYLLDAKPRAD